MEHAAQNSSSWFVILLWVTVWGGAILLGILAVRKPSRAPRLARWAWALTGIGGAFSLVTVGLIVLGLNEALSSTTLSAHERAMLETGGTEATMMSAFLSFIMLVFAPLCTAVALTIMRKRLRLPAPLSERGREG